MKGKTPTTIQIKPKRVNALPLGLGERIVNFNQLDTQEIVFVQKGNVVRLNGELGAIHGPRVGATATRR
ncbi:MAG: hypothetical protein CMI31_05795 [Opitutae bacterium]|nr:hypothetical protein [Opitutae bacterium]